MKQSCRKCVVTLWSQDLPMTRCREVRSKAHAGADGTKIGDTRGVGKCRAEWERFGLGSCSAALELAPSECSTSSREASGN